MKNKMKILFLISAIIVLQTSCATYNKKAVSNLHNIAIVSIQSDKSIKLGEFQHSLSANILKFLNGEVFELTTVVEKARTEIFNNLPGSFPFEIIDEGSVLNSQAYKNIPTESDERFIIPEGYKPFSKSKVKDFLVASPDIDGAMGLAFTYHLAEAGPNILGITTAKVESVLTIYIFDHNAKNILSTYFWGESNNTIPAGNDTFSPEELMGLAQEATNDSINNLIIWIESEY